MPYRVLLVDTNPDTVSEASRALTTNGYLVGSAAAYDEARRRLELAPPDLLVADVRLGTHNGLQLVLRSRLECPKMAAIVTHIAEDPVLAQEATRAGAVFLVKPIPTDRLLEVARAQLAGRAPAPTTEIPRRWPRKAASVGAVLGNREVRVIDLSYGGVCLELADVPDPRWARGDHLTLAPVGQVPVRVVWSRPASTAGRRRWVCGAEVLVAQRPRKHQTWRYFVDSVA